LSVCWNCGEEILFRHVDGVLRPIHLSGGACSGNFMGGENSIRRISGDPVSYTNPNALCPVCSKRVFFYQSPHGGRVFFNSLGWPWPKHECMDKSIERSGRAVLPLGVQRYPTAFRNKEDEIMDIWSVLKVVVQDQLLKVNLYERQDRASAVATIGRKFMEKNSILLDDIRFAPSFLSRRRSESGAQRTLDFICGSKREIIKIYVAFEITSKGMSPRN